MSQELVSKSSAAITHITTYMYYIHTTTIYYIHVQRKAWGRGAGGWAGSLCYFAQLLQGHSLYGHSECTEKEKANSTLSRLGAGVGLTIHR